MAAEGGWAPFRSNPTLPALGLPLPFLWLSHAVPVGWVQWSGLLI